MGLAQVQLQVCLKQINFNMGARMMVDHAHQFGSLSTSNGESTRNDVVTLMDIGFRALCLSPIHIYIYMYIYMYIKDILGDPKR